MHVDGTQMLKLLDLANLLLLIYWAAEPLYPICRYGFRLFWHVDDVSDPSPACLPHDVTAEEAAAHLLGTCPDY